MSLTRVIAQLPTPEFIDNLNTESFELRETNPDSALIAIDKAITQSIQFRYKKEEARGKVIKGIILFKYSSAPDFPQALELFNEALVIRTALNDSAGVASVHNNMSNLYQLLRDYDSALYHIDTSIQLYESLDHYNLGRAYNNKGNIYLYQSNIGEAKEWYKRGFEASKKVGDEKNMSITQENLGATKTDKKRIDVILNHYLDLHNSYKLKKDINSLALISNNIGHIYLSKGNIKIAEKYFKDGEEFAQKAKNYIYLTDSFSGLQSSKN